MLDFPLRSIVTTSSALPYELEGLPQGLVDAPLAVGVDHAGDLLQHQRADAVRVDPAVLRLRQVQM